MEQRLLKRGNRVVLRTDGSFDIQTLDGSKILFQKAGKKTTMIDKNSFIDFLRCYFSSKTIKVEHFDSGCSLVDIFLNEKDVLCVQIEPSQIGISTIEDFTNYFDLSNASDNVFYSNVDAETFVLNMTI